MNTKGVLDSNVDGCGTNGSGDKGGDGEFNCIEDPEAVTPVARETLDGTQTTFSSSSW